MIPRVLHQIWVGPAGFPDEFAAYAETWRRHHPGWEYRLWTEAEIPAELRRPEARERLRMPAERSDILRLEILWREGGVYVDTDFECRGSLEPHLDGAEFVTANLFPHRVNNAFIASVPGHVILDEALAEMKPREFFGFDKWAAGPFFFNRIVQRHQHSPGVRLLPPALMYPRTPAGASGRSRSTTSLAAGRTSTSCAGTWCARSAPCVRSRVGSSRSCEPTRRPGGASSAPSAGPPRPRTAGQREGSP